MKVLATVGQPAAIRYASSFKSSAALAANTAETVFSAASNVNGAYVWRARMMGANASSVMTQIALIAHTAAPGSITTGDVIAQTSQVFTQSTLFGALLTLDEPIFVPPGKGLYFLNGVAETTGYRSALYNLL